MFQQLYSIQLNYGNSARRKITTKISRKRERAHAREKSHKNLKNQSTIVWIDGQCAPESHSNRYESAVRFMLRTNCIATYTLVQTMKWTMKLDLRGYKWPFVYRIHCALPIHFCAVIFRIVFSVAERTLVSMPMDLASMQGSHKYHDIFIDCGLFAAFNIGQIWIFLSNVENAHVCQMQPNQINQFDIDERTNKSMPNENR